jgi:GNAT superfamily N-acetyltransferase
VNPSVAATGSAPGWWPAASASVPFTDEHGIEPVSAVLRDGSRVRIRQARRTDRDLLVRGFERLSPESRYRRFLTPMHELDERTLRYLTDLDHRDHEAMIALDESGDGVGVARYVRSAVRPDTAEVAVAVVDRWQGRGLGTLLLRAISARVRTEGVRTFTALMLASNHDMMDLFEHLGRVRIVGRAGGTVEIEVAIPPSASEQRQRAAGEPDRVRHDSPGAGIGGVELD